MRYRGKPCRHAWVAARALAQFRQDMRVRGDSSQGA
jgi:hypothetical protein